MTYRFYKIALLESTLNSLTPLEIGQKSYLVDGSVTETTKTQFYTAFENLVYCLCSKALTKLLT